MDRIQRMISQVAGTLFTLALINITSGAATVAAAESVVTSSIERGLTGSTSTGIPLPWPIWLLGIALIGVAVIVRRKTSSPKHQPQPTRHER